MIMPGVGSEIYRGLATVIVGGMGVSALFTLVLFPSLLRLGERGDGQNSAQDATPAQDNITPLHSDKKLLTGSN